MHAAVKIIDKTTIEAEEKGLLRSEIAGKLIDWEPLLARRYETTRYK
jgi:hypothetical protein